MYPRTRSFNKLVGNQYGWPWPLVLLVAAVVAPAILIAEEAPRAAPEDFALVKLGETVEFGAGHSITVSGYEADVPFESEGVLGLMTGVANVFHVEICAGSSALAGFVSETYFTVIRWRGVGWESRNAVGAIHPGIRDPRLNDSLLPLDVAAGSCRKGWAVVAVPDEQTAFPGTSAIGFDSPLLSAVTEEPHVKYAWVLE